MLKLIDSKNGSLQHNAAFALYGLADNEVQLGCSVIVICSKLSNLEALMKLLLQDNVADLIKVGGVQKLQDGEFTVQVCSFILATVDA